MAKYNNDDMGQDLQGLFRDRDGMKFFLEEIVNRAMAAEAADHLQAQQYQRTDSRRGYRNGSKPRRFATRVGSLDLSVPQVRGCEPYHPSMFSRFQRSERALLVTCAEMYFQGVSTRKVQKVLDQMCGSNISSSTVSCIAAELDEKLSSFRSRRLNSNIYPCLQIDARYEKIRVDGRVVSQAVLVVVGINIAGEREILDWRIADSESLETWGDLFRQLKDRGLKGLELVVSDAHSGIIAALARHFQGVSWQRCRVHFKRELANKVSYKLRKEMMRDSAIVFAGEDKSECLLRGREIAEKWKNRYPLVGKMLEEGLENCLTVTSYPSPVRRKTNSTNMIENIMKRLKQRTQVVGVFPSRSACDRLIGAQLIELHEKWATAERPYMNMELWPSRPPVKLTKKTTVA